MDTTQLQRKGYRWNSIDGIVSKIHKHKPIKKITTDDIKKMVVEIQQQPKIQEKIIEEDYHFLRGPS